MCPTVEPVGETTRGAGNLPGGFPRDDASGTDDTQRG